MEKVKVSREVAKALDDLRHEKELENSEIFGWHKKKLADDGWRSNLYEPLNNISLEAMYEILTQGYEVDTDRPTPKTPHQMGRIAPAVQVKSSEMALKAELDYELACLHDAIQQDDQIEVARSKQRLKEIQQELEGLGC